VGAFIGELERRPAAKRAQFEWVFEALWCDPRRKGAARRHTPRSLELDIPDTILLREGKFSRWLFTSRRTGCVMKRQDQRLGYTDIGEALLKLARDDPANGARYVATVRTIGKPPDNAAAAVLAAGGGGGGGAASGGGSSGGSGGGSGGGGDDDDDHHVSKDSLKTYHTTLLDEGEFLPWMETGGPSATPPTGSGGLWQGVVAVQAFVVPRLFGAPGDGATLHNGIFESVLRRDRRGEWKHEVQRRSDARVGGAQELRSGWRAATVLAVTPAAAAAAAAEAGGAGGSMRTPSSAAAAAAGPTYTVRFANGTTAAGVGARHVQAVLTEGQREADALAHEMLEGGGAEGLPSPPSSSSPPPQQEKTQGGTPPLLFADAAAEAAAVAEAEASAVACNAEAVSFATGLRAAPMANTLVAEDWHSPRGEKHGGSADREGGEGGGAEGGEQQAGEGAAQGGEEEGRAALAAAAAAEQEEHNDEAAAAAAAAASSSAIQVGEPVRVWRPQLRVSPRDRLLGPSAHTRVVSGATRQRLGELTRRLAARQSVPEASTIEGAPAAVDAEMAPVAAAVVANWRRRTARRAALLARASGPAPPCAATALPTHEVQKFPARVPHEVDEQLVEMERLGLAYATDILKHDPEGFCVNVSWVPPHVIIHQHRTLQDGSPASAAARDKVTLGDAIVGINGVWVGDSSQLWSSLAAEEEDRERDEEHFDWVLGHLAAVPAGTECRFHLVRRHKKDDLTSFITQGLPTIADHCDARQQRIKRRLAEHENKRRLAERVPRDFFVHPTLTDATLHHVLIFLPCREIARLGLVACLVPKANCADDDTRRWWPRRPGVTVNESHLIIFHAMCTAATLAHPFLHMPSLPEYPMVQGCVNWEMFYRCKLHVGSTGFVRARLRATRADLDVMYADVAAMRWTRAATRHRQSMVQDDDEADAASLEADRLDDELMNECRGGRPIDLDALRGLLLQGADPEFHAPHFDSCTAIHLAAINHKHSYIQLLVAAGADVNALGRTAGSDDSAAGETPLDIILESTAVDEATTDTTAALLCHLGGMTKDEAQAPTVAGFGISRADGDHYEGNWAAGKFEGVGTMRYSNGTRFEGQWANGLPDGQGKQADIYGCRFSGQFKCGKMHGHGIEVECGNKYEGQWANDEREGKGCQIHSDGRRFEGTFRNDVPAGHGILHIDTVGWRRGEKVIRYEGQWDGGSINGLGSITVPGEYRYEGQLQNSVEEGQGIVTFENNTYKGSWKDGYYDGSGTFTLANGNRYQGQHVKGKCSGKGVFTFADGWNWEGTWRDDASCGIGTWRAPARDLVAMDLEMLERHGEAAEITGAGPKSVSVARTAVPEWWRDAVAAHGWAHDEMEEGDTGGGGDKGRGGASAKQQRKPHYHDYWKINFKLAPEAVPGTSKEMALLPLDKPYLQITGKLKVEELKIYLIEKLALKNSIHEIEILCKGETLGEGVLLVSAEESYWRDEDRDLILTYRSCEDNREKMFRQALELQPDDVPTLSNLARFLLTKTGGREEVIALFRRLLALLPADEGRSRAGVGINLARLLGKEPSGREEALALFRRMLDSTAEGSMCMMLEYALVLKREPSGCKEAEAVLRRAVALHSDSDPRGALVTQLALVLEKESSEEAHKLYRKTLMQHPNNPNPFTLLSFGHFLSKDPERQSEAKHFFQRWVAVAKHTPLSLQRFESDTQYCWIFQLYLKYLK
jgi:tetratricopeptide (TPR) repeat protein